MFGRVSVRVYDNGIPIRIDRLTHRELNSALRRGVSKAATVARAEAKRDAPKQTGNLRRNIAKRTLRSGLVAGAVAAEVYIKPDGYYGRFLETGTGDRHRKNGGSTGRSPKEPFLAPAAEYVQPLVGQLIEFELASAIRRAGL